MAISSVFCFEKSKVALSELEKLLTFQECKKMYCNVDRHVTCGNIKCGCQQEKRQKCMLCSKADYKSSFVKDCFVNSVAEEARKIRKLLTPTEERAVQENSNENNVLLKTASTKRTQKSIASAENNLESEIVAPEYEEKHVKTSRDSPVSYKSGRKPRRRNTTPCIQQFSAEKNTRKSIGIKELMKRNNKGETALHTACVKGDRKKVEELLMAGANPCTQDNAKWTPLHEAVSKGYTDIVKLLLEAGALVNVPGCFNNTPLHDAALNNHLVCAKLLMAYGADPNMKNIEGNTPRYMANTPEMHLILEDKSVCKNDQKINVHIYQEDLVLYSDIPRSQQEQITTFTKQFKMKRLLTYNSDVTLIVVADNKECSSSLAILMGILKGKWIVQSQWLQQCCKENTICDPDPYEITGTVNYPNSYAPQKARENAQKMLPSIFNGCHFYLYGGDSYLVGKQEFSKTDLKSLITQGDGVVWSREPNPEAIPANEKTVPFHANENGALANCSHYIIYQPEKAERLLKYKMAHLKALPVSWLLKCVETFTLSEPTEV